MHQALLDLAATRLKPATSTNVNAKTTTFGGNLTHNQLDELIRTATMCNATVSLVAGVLTLTSG